MGRRCWQKWVDNGRFQRNDGSGRPVTIVAQEDRLLSETYARTDCLLSHLPLTPTHCRARLQWCFALPGWNHAD
ncbi:hypothetical protein TNCV_3511681 [Trichonephila clavipes]|nr:hypothetical protein TNCV_3511681 [Trichonephila clavipes]